MRAMIFAVSPDGVIGVAAPSRHHAGDLSALSE